MQDFRKLDIYKEAKELALKVYTITYHYPDEEKYGMTQQLRRAVTSIGANIAEGSGRKSNQDFSRFLTMSLGSVNEARYFIEMSKDLDYISGSEYAFLSRKIRILGGKIYNFIQAIK